jgi:hypothetical protein
MPFPQKIGTNYLFINNAFYNPYTPDYLRDVNLANATFDESVAYVTSFPYKEWAVNLAIYIGLDVKYDRYVYKITGNTNAYVVIPDGAIPPTHTTGSVEHNGITYQYICNLFDMTDSIGLINPPKARGQEIVITSISGNGTTVTVTFADQSPNPAPYSSGDKVTIIGVSTTLGYNGTWTVASCNTTTLTYLDSTTGTGTTTNAKLIGPYIDDEWIQDSTVYRALFNNNGDPSEPGLDAGNFDSSSNAVILLRSSLEEGITNYKQIALFDSTQFAEPKYFYDYLIEPGILYSYILQTATIDLSTYKILSRGSTTPLSQRINIIPDFTGSYLYGVDDVQINFTYSGEISGFKEVKKDAVIETIGSKYPFVIRNSDIGYKQFSFSATVTSISDPMRQLGGLTYAQLMSGFDDVNINTSYEKFINEGPQQILGDISNLNFIGTIQNKQYLNRNENFLVEKEFRKKLMSWLYDGQPKIFKSDTEGLILVKLTDISFEPFNELGRLIYKFSCTATEIDAISSDSLVRYGFRKATYFAENLFSYSQLGSKILQWKANTFYPEGLYLYNNKKYYKVVSSGISGATPPISTDPDSPFENGSTSLVYTGTYIPGYFQ